MSLNGFIVDVHCASESNLEVEIECTQLPWPDYKDLIDTLEDTLSIVDEEHSAKSWLVRGRGLKARYRRVTAEERQRKMRFSPFPSKFANILKNTRTHVYNQVAMNCLVLEKVGARKVYLLPKEVAPLFVEAIEKLNIEVIAPLRKGLEDFRKTPDYQKIEQCLYNHHIGSNILQTASFPIGDFIVNITPVDFGYSVSRDEIYAKMQRGEAMKGLEMLRMQVERQQKEYAANAVSDLIMKISKMAEGLESGKKMKNPKAKVDKLIMICNSLSLDSIREKILEPMKLVCTAKNPDRSRLTNILFGKASLKEGVEEGLKTLPLLEGRIEEGID